MKQKAIVYCDGAFNTPSGKTAHGLVRFTERYEILAVIDHQHAGHDAAEVLDGKPIGIPVVADMNAAMEVSKAKSTPPTHFVIGLAPDGGRLPDKARQVVVEALGHGMNIDSGLHDFLSDDANIAAIAAEKKLTIRDVRKTPPRNQMHFFSGKIEQVDCLKVALLGTDSAIGKRTTAWILVHALRDAGWPTELIGTGQTAWLQGAQYSIVLDSLINDFVSGEIEHAVWSAWSEKKPRAVVVEGQGSLMNPAYPGGFEILAAARPDCIVLQHAPARKEYDGFPGYPIHPLAQQIQAIELLSGRSVVAITINHENMTDEEIESAKADIKSETGLPAFDVLQAGGEGLADLIRNWKPLTRSLAPNARE